MIFLRHTRQKKEKNRNTTSLVFSYVCMTFSFRSDLVTWLGDGGRRCGGLLPRAKPYHSRFQCGKLQVKKNKQTTKTTTTTNSHIIRIESPSFCYHTKRTHSFIRRRIYFSYKNYQQNNCSHLSTCPHLRPLNVQNGRWSKEKVEAVLSLVLCQAPCIDLFKSPAERHLSHTVGTTCRPRLCSGCRQDKIERFI